MDDVGICIVRPTPCSNLCVLRIRAALYHAVFVLIMRYMRATVVTSGAVREGGF